MVTDPDGRRRGDGRLDDDEIDTNRVTGERKPVRERSGLYEATDRGPQVPPLAPVERLLGQTVIPPRPPADLNEHDTGRRPRIERHEVDLLAADPDVAGQDRPAERDEPLGCEHLSGIAGPLCRRAPARSTIVHPPNLTTTAYRAVAARRDVVKAPRSGSRWFGPGTGAAD